MHLGHISDSVEEDIHLTEHHTGCLRRLGEEQDGDNSAGGSAKSIWSVLCIDLTVSDREIRLFAIPRHVFSRSLARFIGTCTSRRPLPCVSMRECDSTHGAIQLRRLSWEERHNLRRSGRSPLLMCCIPFPCAQSSRLSTKARILS